MIPLVDFPGPSPQHTHHPKIHLRCLSKIPMFPHDTDHPEFTHHFP